MAISVYYIQYMLNIFHTNLNVVDINLIYKVLFLLNQIDLPAISYSQEYERLSLAIPSFFGINHTENFGVYPRAGSPHASITHILSYSSLQFWLLIFNLNLSILRMIQE